MRILCFLMVSSAVFANENRSKAQLKSIHALYFRGSSKPQKPTPSELKRAQKLLSNVSHGYETNQLKKVYGNNLDLIAYAMRDSDGDGIFDYRIGLNWNGRFFEGDPDVDGDGVENALDTHPYDPRKSKFDRNRNDIPDSVDFVITMRHRLGRRSLQLASKIQRELWVNHKILLVERNTKFSLANLVTIRDAVRMVFARLFMPNESLPTLRTIAAENNSRIVSPEDDACAFVFAPAKTMVLYDECLKTAPIFQLGAIVHELGHSYQYALDWDEGKPYKEYIKTYFKMPKFKRLISRYQWTPRRQNLIKRHQYKLFAPYTENRSKFLYRRKSVDYWQDWLSDLNAQIGDRYLSDRRVIAKNIIGDYSLSSPLEWHSDHLIAYLFKRMHEHAKNQVRNYQKLKHNFRQAEKQFWPGFKHANIGDQVYQDFSQQFAIADADLAKLSQRYLIKEFR